MLACTPSLPEPLVTGVSPDWGYNGELTHISISGRNFFPMVELDVREDGARFDRQFVVELHGGEGVFDLEGVELRSYEQLDATVPEGLPVGLYDIVVTSPEASSSRLRRAFNVTDTRSDHLAFDVEDVVYDVQQIFTVGFDLEDPEDAPVLEGLEILLTITSDQGVDDLQFDDLGLTDPQVETLDGGYGVIGSLRPTGHGYVTITATTPDTLQLQVEPTDAESVVEGDTILIGVEAGQLQEVLIELPSESFSSVAGEEFQVDLQLVDAYDNPLEEASANLLIYETCGDFSTTAKLVGSGQATVALRGATGDDCPENHVLATGSVSGSSAGLEVEPAAAGEYEVQIYPASVLAGTEILYLLITARDDYGNLIPDYGDSWEQTEGEPLEVTLYDQLGGLDPDIGHGEQGCPGFMEGSQLCWAQLHVSGNDDVVTALGDDGVEGQSPAFDVLTGDLAQIWLTIDPGPFTAGEPFQVEVQPTDAYSNGLETDPRLESYVFSGEPGDLDCVWDERLLGSGRRFFDCTATLAVEPQTLTVSIDSLDPDIQATSEAFTVLNGDLAQVQFDIAAGSELTAGQDLTFSLVGFDAWGNPYLEQADPDLELNDDTGTLTVTTASLDEDGQAQVTATITEAMEADAISAWQGGIELGASDAFEVVHAEVDRLDVVPEQRWIFIGDELQVQVQALDAWDNPVLDFDEEVTLTAQAGSAEELVLSDFEQGSATTQMVFDAPEVAEVLEATSSETGKTGAYDAVDALEGDCGVEADLLLDGDTEAVICLASGSATVTLDASGSTGSGLTYHYSDSTGESERTSAASITTTWAEPAAIVAQVVAFDAAGCGSEALAVAWVAEPDGSPAGPVDIVPQDYVRVVGSATDGATQVDVQAYDCARDVAAGQQLYLRSDLGEFTSGVTATGQGLEVSLDKTGSGSAIWSVASDVYGGTATLYAGLEGGLAIGTTAIDVQGDDALPRVLGLDPYGSSSEITDTITVSFSEAMRSSSLHTGSVSFSDSVGPLTIDDLELDDSERNLTITLTAAVDLGADSYELALTDQVRDSSGNRIDGGWTGSAGAFSAELGAVGDSAPDVSICVADTDTLRPDGDDVGATSEADFAEITVVALGVPTWWRMEITDEDGEARGVHWQAETALVGDLLWDARGLNGHVLDNGSYTVTIQGADTYLNLGSAYELILTIDNQVVEVP